MKLKIVSVFVAIIIVLSSTIVLTPRINADVTDIGENLDLGKMLLSYLGNTPPSKPQKPVGFPLGGLTNHVFYFYTTSYDAEDDIIQYRFDWGDGEISEWTALFPSGQTIRDYHKWFSAGTYDIKAQARDEYGALSDWSDPASFELIPNIPDFTNYPPEVPDILLSPEWDPTYFEVGSPITLKAVSADPEGDKIQYLWDVDGDSIFDTCSLFYDSNKEVPVKIMPKNTGSYNVRVKAVDQFFADSGWSDSVQITVHAASENRKPAAPTKPGCVVDFGYIYDTYSFDSWCYDPDGDDLYYYWDFGDGHNSGWLGPYKNGMPCSTHHLFDSEEWYYVKVKTCDDPNGDGVLSDGKESSWSEIFVICIRGESDSTIFYPNAFSPNLRYDSSIGAVYNGWLGFQTPSANEEDNPLILNHQTGAISTFSNAAGCLALPLNSIGDSWVEGLIRKDFYLGRDKTVEIEADILYTGATAKYMSGFIDGFVENYKVYHIDTLSEDTKVREKIDFDVGNLENGIEAFLETAATGIGLGEFYYALSASEAFPPNTTPLGKAYYDIFSRYDEVYTQLETSPKVRTLVTCEMLRAFGPFSPLLSIGLIIMCILYIHHLGYYCSFSQVNQHLLDLKSEGYAELINLNIGEKNMKKGDHSVWLGLESKVLAPLMGSGMAYSAGLVRNIKITGIAPPGKPTIKGPNEGFVGEPVEIQLKSVDPNNDPVDFIIDWGDGTQTTTDESYNSGETVTVEHKYSRDNTYTIRVTAKDCDRMHSDTSNLRIDVDKDNTPPVVSITRPKSKIYIFDDEYPVDFFYPIIIGDIMVEVDAFDDESDIKNVEFLVDGESRFIDDVYPYSYHWDVFEGGWFDLNCVGTNYASLSGGGMERVYYSNPFADKVTTVQLGTYAPDDGVSKKSWEIKSYPESASEQQVRSLTDDFISELENYYDDVSLSFTFDVDFGDGNSDTITGDYPVLSLYHDYDDKEYTISVTITAALNLDGESYSGVKTLTSSINKDDDDDGSGKSKTVAYPLISMLLQRFPMLQRLISFVCFQRGS